MDLLDRDRVVVQQRVKLIEVTSEYFLHDESGNVIGWVVEEGQTEGHKWLRRLTKTGPMLAHQLAVAGADGHRVLTLYKPASWIKVRVEVRDGSGERVGTVRQQNWFWKPRFTLEDAQGFPLAELRADWRAWHFVVSDAFGNELATVDKQWAGLVEEVFTTADNYAFAIAPTVDGPLRQLCFAAAIAIDQALKQRQG